MKRLLILASCGAFSWGASAPSLSPSIIRLDPRFDALVPPDAVVEKIADGFAWTEGPVWNRATRSLLFSDVPNNRIIEWIEGEGAGEFLKASGYMGSSPFTGREPGSNGLTFDPHGRLVFAQHGDRSISRLERDGSRTRLVGRFQGKRINSPNDLVYRSNGDLYFTDPPFGLPNAFDDATKELAFQGVYRLSRSGELSLLTSEVAAPNGIAFSPDESTMYVSDSKSAKWLAFPVNADGTLGASHVLFDGAGFARGKPGVADGMKVDEHGNVFGAGPGGIYVIAPDGVLLGWFDFGVPTGNCAWGEDGSTLFITSSTAVYRVRLNTRAAHWPVPKSHVDTDNEEDRLIAVTFIEGRTGTEEAMKRELFAIEEPTRAEPGNIAYDLYQSAENPTEFMRFEIWRTPRDLELHKQTPHIEASFERRKEAGWSTRITRWKRIRQDQ